ncbi:hypothetical protein PRZ48_012683 [Zasmidium cellare]|uniref:FAD/NAD(P)-binding domain-containing protein n=1 Tax=Zasmidium cellare TaxID=395010 RepID=A0ABR0E5J3_ZASCE|nr:hypothetical protein PRZ48_012683 [Zasmidium cellare]
MCRLTFSHLLAVVSTLSALTSATQSPPACFESSCYRPSDVIRRDVAIIGGGSSGTYAAVALKHLSQSVVVVEQSSHLGGHFDWYSTPTSAEPIQYGVQGLWNTSVVRDFFARFNVSQQGLPAEQPPDVYYDFTTGTRVQNVSSMLGLSGVVEQAYRFPGLRFSTQLQHPVPNDLLMPFGQFVERHGLEDEAFGVYSNPITDGLVDILNQSTLNAFRALNPAALAEGTGQALVGDYSQLFTRATSELGTNVPSVSGQYSQSVHFLATDSPASAFVQTE